MSNSISVAKLWNYELWNQQFTYDFPQGYSRAAGNVQRRPPIHGQCVTVCQTGRGSLLNWLTTEEQRMPNNCVIAEQCALNLKKNILKSPTFHEDCITFMSDMITIGYAMKGSDEDLNDGNSRNDGNVWYIPHHGV